MKKSERTERIREEILEAKKVAGIAPPRAIPIGDTFRSALSSRPDGAISLELDVPKLREAPNDQAIGTVVAPRKLPKALSNSLLKSQDALLSRINQALDLMEAGEVAPSLRAAVAEQIQIAASVNHEDKMLVELQGRFDKIRFGEVDFKDVKGQPGGAAPNN